MGKDDTPINVNGRIVVDLDIAEGSLVREGKVADLPDDVTDGILEVIAFDKTADIKVRDYRRVCTIRKYKSSLPTIV